MSNKEPKKAKSVSDTGCTFKDSYGPMWTFWTYMDLCGPSTNVDLCGVWTHVNLCVLFELCRPMWTHMDLCGLKSPVETKKSKIRPFQV